ncbi:MAG: VOC family protein [Planctomycetes bacterium]|nr:VOC family protein [Planctomycetota bacterium]
MGTPFDVKAQNAVPCIWFNDQAEEAVKFYTATIPNSEITAVARYGEAGSKVAGKPAGSTMTVTFRIDGRDFMALNGGPYYQLTGAISFVLYCDTQAEIDRLWEALSAGGEKLKCGWLKDRYGVHWQIVPSNLGKLTSGDARKTAKVMEALLKMGKLEVAGLQAAFDQA